MSRFVLIGRLLDADYPPADNRPLPYRCISICEERKSKSKSIFMNTCIANDIELQNFAFDVLTALCFQ